MVECGRFLWRPVLHNRWHTFKQVSSSLFGDCTHLYWYKCSLMTQQRFLKLPTMECTAFSISLIFLGKVSYFLGRVSILRSSADLAVAKLVTWDDIITHSSSTQIRRVLYTMKVDHHLAKRLNTFDESKPPSAHVMSVSLYCKMPAGEKKLLVFKLLS